MSHESARRGPTGNAENPVEAPCKRSCNSLQTPCKRAGEGGPGSEGNEEVPRSPPTRCGWPATTHASLRPSAHGVVDSGRLFEKKGCILQGDGCDVAAVSGRRKF